MKRRFSLFLLALVTFSLFSAAAIGENYNGMVRVEAPIFNSERVWTGVGFFVTDKHIVTCAHILTADGRDYTKDVKILFKGKRYSVKTLDMNKEKDVALLYVGKSIGSPFNICDDSIPGQSIVINYFDDNLDISGRVGRIKKLYLDKDSFGDIAVTAKVIQGNSGSPVIRNQCVVGMVQRVSGFSLGARNLRVFLEKHRIVK
jgi:S1-C subfamily serine protease